MKALNVCIYINNPYTFKITKRKKHVLSVIKKNLIQLIILAFKNIKFQFPIRQNECATFNFPGDFHTEQMFNFPRLKHSCDVMLNSESIYFHRFHWLHLSDSQGKSSPVNIPTIYAYRNKIHYKLLWQTNQNSSLRHHTIL